MTGPFKHCGYRCSRVRKVILPQRSQRAPELAIENVADGWIAGIQVMHSSKTSDKGESLAGNSCYIMNKDHRLFHDRDGKDLNDRSPRNSKGTIF